MPDDLKQQLEQAQADYQKLYAQYQEELAFIAKWQKRMKAENEANSSALARVNDLIDRWTNATDLSGGTATSIVLRAAAAEILTALEGK